MSHPFRPDSRPLKPEDEGVDDGFGPAPVPRPSGTPPTNGVPRHTPVHPFPPSPRGGIPVGASMEAGKGKPAATNVYAQSYW